MLALRIICLVVLISATALSSVAHFGGSSAFNEIPGATVSTHFEHSSHGEAAGDATEAAHCCAGINVHCVFLCPADLAPELVEYDGGRDLKGAMSFALGVGLSFTADPPPPRSIL